ncbi:S-adenosyl-L-methionine-dependent methyltransferase [Podospora fimiseda]|uniref:S-adenosyl-L-methionine-dependent methyltransferase n=1 Tax=Podospora fimiseda TaxID=252190 RepID=A0AAN7GXW2_9PEZI|nr:S-adenosyl-L-methionine-dependent methyltransferase [Podospora fimiseda]
MSSSDSPLTILNTLIFPLKFIFLSLTYLPRALLLTFPSSLSTLQSAWFSLFWSHVGPLVRESASPSVIPLLSGLITRGSLKPTPVHPAISGTVLELGPGSGQWTSTLSRFSSNITKILGVEPNTGIHPLLRSQIKKNNLEDKYTIVPCGVEDLASSGKVEKESVDSIMTVLCLCSIPEPQKNIKELYTYLKPGGRWYVYEHVKQGPEAPRWLAIYQSVLNLIWPHFIGGCEMCRDTPKWLKEAGPWGDIDLSRPEKSVWYETMPNVIGVLTK